MSGDYTLREFQTNLPWTIRYSTDFRSSPLAHKDFAHALHHVSKAAGKLHGVADDMDHDRALADDPTLREQYGKYVADLVVCALRLANTFPGGVLDLQRAVHERIEGKNGVTLPAAVPGPVPGADGWIEWKGGELPPVPGETIVELGLRGGELRPGHEAGIFRWDWSVSGTDAYDIVAYRVLALGEPAR